MLSNLMSQERYEHHINNLALSVSENGALLFRRSQVLYATWPYESRYFSLIGRKMYQESWGVWLGANEFLGVQDTIPSPKVVACGSFYLNFDDVVPLSLQKRMRYPFPSVMVDDGNGPLPESFESGVHIVSSLPCDEQIESVWTTTLGLTVQLKTYAYATTGHRDYIIFDYRFINTGNIDKDPMNRELKDELKDVWLGFVFSTDIKPKFGGKDYDDYYEYYGANYKDWVNGDKSADSARVFIVWDGPEGTGNYDPDPITNEPRVPGYYGVGFLHVDKQAVDDLEFGSSDDPSQPKSVNTESAGEASSSSQYQKLSLSENENVSGVGAESYIMSCGPYNIPINEDVRIVIVQIIAGISRENAEELGRQLLSGTITKEDYEQTIATGRDSLFKALAAAKLAFSKRFNIPDPPPSPDSLLISSGVGHIKLEWSANAEAAEDPDTKVNDFAGCRVYRVINDPTDKWEKIFECGGDSSIPITNTYIDDNVISGFDYYYAVTAFDDGTQNYLHPGLSLESSRLTSNVFRGGVSQQTPMQNLNSLRVVPNPYNIRARGFGDPNNIEDVANNRILFVGLPEKCTIRIYTVYGDLVKTLKHINGLGSEPWDQITEYQQYITSGLYIAHVESEKGNAIIKFVVVR